MDKVATSKQIVATIRNEWLQGKHQGTIQDLPFEIQFRLGCTWGRALSYANEIRVRYSIVVPKSALHGCKG